MTLVRRNQNWLPTIFNDFVDNDWIEPRMANTIPAINVKESKNDYVVEVAAPGMTKEDFKVNIDQEENLVITTEKRNETKDENKETHYLRRDFSYSKFQQTILLPDDVEKDTIDAKVEHGVLTIKLNKKPEVAKTNLQRTIEIK